MSELLKRLLSFQGIPQVEFPKIPLYMDQLLMFFDETLGAFRRDAHEPILTKTMVNNYVKARVLPPPVAKKYSREQMMQLRLVVHLKNVLSIEDIRRLAGAGKNGAWAYPVEECYRLYDEAEAEALEAIRQRLTDYEGECTPEDRARMALKLAAEANLLKLAAERLI